MPIGYRISPLLRAPVVAAGAPGAEPGGTTPRGEPGHPRVAVVSAAMPPCDRPPITLALIDDYDVVILGLAQLFEGYQDRVRVVEFDASVPLEGPVDIALYDSFAQPEADHDEVADLARNPRARRVVVYTWNFHPELVDAALSSGAAAYLSKTLPARELVEALEAVHRGERVISAPPPRSRIAPGLDWPGRRDGLTEREAEILALITQGKSNAEIAELTFLSKNSIKSHVRSAYRKVGVTSRVEAVLWGVEHGFRPDHHRIESWRHRAVDPDGQGDHRGR